ncbi:MAG: radical SAM protein [Coprococcus sp.]
MQYEGTVYRPPSEAHSLIVQITVGCAHNTCTFCTMYKDKKFRIRPKEAVMADFEEAAMLYGPHIRRIFLADGDALIVKTVDLLDILGFIRQRFPNLERVTAYGTAQDILHKTKDELRQLKAAGLDMIYMGLESGDPEILEDIHKGVSREQLSEAGRKLQECGILCSATLISGLGGRQRLREHAIASASLVSEIKPAYVGFLTLMIDREAPIYPKIESGELALLNPEDVVEEMRLFLGNVDSEGTIFRANHASNYVILKGTLNKDIPAMMAYLDQVEQSGRYRAERFRRL